MKKFTLIYILVVLMFGDLFPQTFLLDSLKTKVYTNQNDTIKLKSLKEISRLFLKDNFDSSMFYANKMLVLAEGKQILYYVSDAYDLKSNIYEHEGKLEKCVVSIDSAKYYAELINDPVGVIYFINNKAGIYIKMGRYFEALQSFEEVRSIGERINRPSSIAAALNNIGAVYHYLGDDETALDYFIQAYELRFENNITEKLAYSLNNIGAIYAKYGNYQEALIYHKKALQAAITNNDNYNYLVALINMGLDYDFLNDFRRALKYYSKALKEANKQGDKTLQSHALERMSSIYAEEDNIAKAKPLIIKALDISKSIKNKYDIASFSNSLGIVYLKEKNYADAHSLFMEALTVSKEIRASELEADTYKSLTAYYYSINNSEKAFAYQKLFDVIRDSLYESEIDLKIANLKNRFELDLKLDELELKDLELSSTKKISKERLQIIYVIGIAGLLMLILAIYILFLYKKIRQQNQLIRQSEKKVKELLEKEQELGKLKTQLISTVSHEFRTPMAIISSNVQMIRDFNDSMDEPMRQETLKYIYSGVENMLSMMKNFEVLDSKTILEFNPKPINLVQVCNNLSNELQSLPEYYGRINFVSSFALDEVVMDKSLITHIVRNLLINALKFSGEKQIDFVIGNINEEEVIISVSDKGVGMSEYDVDQIFENFHRGSNATNVKGTGVGMSVVKRCVNLHRGRVEVESKIGEGTIINVILPFN